MRIARFLLAIAALCAWVPMASAQLYLPYTAEQFPEDAGLGWIKTPQSFPADRTIEGGMLVESPEWLGAEGTQNFYLHYIDEHADFERWVLEWRVETTGTAQFSGTAPVSMTAANEQGYEYRFVIGVDQFQFSRGPGIPFIELPIEAGPHTYRLECLNSQGEQPAFAITVDGQVIDSGIAVGPYPTVDSLISFGSRTSHAMDNVTKWHYVNVGDPAEPVPAVETWGAMILLGFLLVTGTLTFKARRPDRAMIA